MADKNLRIRLLLEGLDRVSKPLRDVSASSTRAAQDLKATRERLAELNKTGKAIDAFRKLQTDALSTKAALKEAQRALDVMSAEMVATAAPTAAMQRNYDRSTKSVAKLATEHRRQGTALEELRGKLRDAGVSTTSLGTHEKKLKRDIEATTESVTRQGRKMAALNEQTRMIKGVKGAFNQSQDQATTAMANGAAGVTAGVALSLPLKLVAQDAMGFEDKMADVRKVVDGLDRKPAFDKMSSDIIALSTRLPMAAEGIAAIVAAGARSGIKNKGELLAYAEDAAKMGVAFDMQADAAGEMMATWRTAFGLNQKGVVQLADQVNALTNSYGGNTSRVNEMITRIGPLGKIAGVAAPLLASLGQVMDKNGVQAEIGSTGIKNMLLTLTKGTAATKDQAKAFKALGLDAVDMSKRMQTDAAGAIVDILARIKKLPKDGQASILSELFGTESVAAIAPLINNIDQLRTNIGFVGDASKYAGSMQKEFNGRAATTSNAVLLADNNFKALKITVGTQLLPAITDLSRQMGSGIAAVTAFAKAHPQAVIWLVKLVAALAGIMLAGAAFNFLRAGLLATFAPLRMLANMLNMKTGEMLLKGVKWLGSGLARVGPLIARFAVLIARAAMFMATGIMRAGLFLMANPLVLAIIALVAVLAIAGYLIYTHWDTIKKAVFGAIASIGAALDGLNARIGAVIDAIVKFVSSLGPRMKGYLIGWIIYFRPLPGLLREMGRNMIMGLINGITGMLGRLKNTIVNAAGSAAGWFKKKMGIQSPSRVFMGFGGHLMTGLARGIDQQADRPVDRIARTARGMIDALPSALKLSMPTQEAGLPRAPDPRRPAVGLPPPALPVPASSRSVDPRPAAPPSPIPRPVPKPPVRGEEDRINAAGLLRDVLAAIPAALRLSRQPASPMPALATIGVRLASATAISLAAPAAARPPASPAAVAPAAAAIVPPLGPIEIHIHQKSGQDAQDLARAVRAELEAARRSDAARARSSFADTPDWK